MPCFTGCTSPGSLLPTARRTEESALHIHVVPLSAGLLHRSQGRPSVHQVEGDRVSGEATQEKRRRKQSWQMRSLVLGDLRAVQETAEWLGVDSVEVVGELRS